MNFFELNPSTERQILDFRPFGFQDVVLLGRYRYAKTHHVLGNHCHGNMLEICYLERGKQTYYVGDDHFDLVGGDVFITFPGEIHGTGPKPEERGVLFWMLICIPENRESFLWAPPSLSEHLLQRLLNMPIRHFQGGDYLGHTLNQIFKTCDRDDDPLKAVKLQNLILRFLLDTLDASEARRRQVTPRIKEVQKFVVDNIDCNLSIKQLAQVARLSPSRFQARFKMEVGMSPSEYMQREKIDRARRLLEDGKYNVTKIAMQLGFSTSHYFTTVFKRYLGITPSDYRSQMQRTES